MKENLENNEEKISDYNFIISQNKVLFVPKITNNEIKSGGKYCFWQDYNTGNTVQILDKDYGKSAELMRSLLETDSYTPFWKKALIFLILWVIIFWVWSMIFSFSWSEEKKNEIIKVLPNIGDKVKIIKDETILQKEKEKEIIVNTKWPLDENIKIQNNKINNLKKDFEIESLKIEIQRIIDEKNLLTHKNFELWEKIAEKNNNIKLLTQEIIIYKEKLRKYTEKPQNLTQEAFLLHLGNIVYDGCEKAELEGDKNKCKDIYFKFIQND